MDREWLADKSWWCVDCGIHTGAILEYYMVRDSIWDVHGAGRGMLCIGCLELRLGRLLNRKDFPPLPINTGAFHQSDRLAQRLRRKEEE